MQLTAGRILNHPISAALPNFSFLDNRNFSDTLAALEETKFDLSKAVNLSISRQMAFRTIAEYLSHQHAIYYDMQNTDDFFFGMFNRFRTPLAIASIGLSVVALIFTVIVSVKIRTLSLLLLSARPIKAASIKFDFFVSTTTETLIPTSSTFPIVVGNGYLNIFLICLVGLFVILLAGLFTSWMYNRYFSYKIARQPYTNIFLQLNTNKTQIYLKFSTLRCNVSSYVFIAKDVCLKLKVQDVYPLGSRLIGLL